VSHHGTELLRLARESAVREHRFAETQEGSLLLRSELAPLSGDLARYMASGAIELPYQVVQRVSISASGLGCVET
jgi:hypothetical protein